jgi:hypothetical protein
MWSLRDDIRMVTWCNCLVARASKDPQINLGEQALELYVYHWMNLAPFSPRCFDSSSGHTSLFKASGHNSLSPAATPLHSRCVLFFNQLREEKKNSLSPPRFFPLIALPSFKLA